MTFREKVNILMVDDQPAKLLSYEVILNELNENLIKANSGREALEHLLKEDIAVVLMDVSMPEIDGFELADMIRQHPRFQKTAIIFISGVHLTDLDRLKGYERGAVDYISVPVNPELLRARVSVFADLHRKTQQLELLNKELRNLSSNLIATQDDERRRIARELHDSLGQELSAAKMMVDKIISLNRSTESTKEATEISNLIDHAIQQVRSISYLLHPPLLDEIGLQSALQFYLEGFTKRSGIEVFLDVKPSSFPRLALEMETAIFRIIQEAVTNVFRHSGAREAWVTLAREDGQIIGTVRDNGKGLADGVMEGKPDRIGVGIGGMRQRVKEFGGDLRIGNASPGTIVEVSVPIESLTESAQGSGNRMEKTARRQVAY
ncbi:MAG TPA: response regulator [Candidatus Saccharimonadales bacterium]|jgi:signal transduction histidine kinase|nr:response regulator [Candidatus Saccharimonadales bacterium]